MAAPPKYTEEQLQHFHRDSFKNQRYLEEALEAGCYYCLTIFPPSKIEEWWDDEVNGTAVCPWCGIDSVLLTKPNELIDPALLVEMQAKYFEHGSAASQLPEDLRDWHSLLVKRRGFDG